MDGVGASPNVKDANDAPDARRPTVTPKDGLRVLMILVACLGSWTVPQRFWRPAALRISRWWMPFRSERAARHDAATLGKLLGDRIAEADLVEIVARKTAMRAEVYVSRFRHLSPFGNRSLQWRLSGTEHIDAALADGSGAILWVNGGNAGSVFSKIALHHSGYGVHHLSHEDHGLSGSEFTRRYLFPIWLDVEKRHIAERIVMSGTRKMFAMRHLRRVLAANGIVSITVYLGPDTSQVVEIPFLGRCLRLATGPASLSAQTKAPLIPVFCAPADIGIQVIVERPLRTVGGDGEPIQMADIARDYAKRFEPYIVAAPELWPWGVYWRMFSFDGKA
jgi:lauroyl/myristoyl acyltransferase